ncbi:MAG: Teichoic acid export ATP-binding protein TagH [uncultured Rubrobacteraceae bacterium]|uniref:Teichoic acid export ATP-binding protein TagH n=1 Tax=uncultured Rubrobacteraceae bacterium TaxID=349277 RepID=A0A6J4R0H5_9ACTN|nr:MAG: Teichoic acid export ATP-binding protein TagH [uncultured Rubrobacteraceae bacterium]
MTPAISLRGIGKKYRISPSRSSRLGEILSFGKAKRSHEFWALQDFSLDVEPGTTLGVVGRNGAGKSTLLSIISGVLRPTTGEVEVEGRLSAIFGIGTGFNPLFTGRENAMLSGLILGIEHDEMVARFDDIEAFADIGEFMDQPIKTYSSGMRSRLGFAVAINVEPDVLVIDEALSAGDSAFKKKAIQRMYDLKDSGSTVLFVSHSMGMVKRFCTEAVLLHKGRLVTTGSPEEVVDYYEEMLAKSQEMKDAGHSELDKQLDYEIEHEDEEDTPTKDDGLGTPNTSRIVGGAEILGLELLDENGRAADALSSGATLTVRVRLRYDEAMEESTLRITLQSERAGLEVFSTDTDLEGVPIGRKDEGERATVDFTFAIPLGPGIYKVDASLKDPHAEDSDVARTQNAATFEITREGALVPVRGLVRLPTEVEIHGGPEGQQERLA